MTTQPTTQARLDAMVRKECITNHEMEQGSICMARRSHLEAVALDLLQRLEEQEARIEALEKALRFYGSPGTYDEYGIPRVNHVGHRGCSVPDSGETARAALKGGQP